MHRMTQDLLLNGRLHLRDHIQAELAHLPRVDVGVFLLGLADQGADGLLFAGLNVGDDPGVGGE